MASRRDQIESYQYLTRRVVAAFVTRETDPELSPLRRGVGSLFSGVMVAVVLGAGFGVYGLLTKTGVTSWQEDGTVVVEKETGASYVYRGGTLYPALNYASALLAAGKAPPVTVPVPARSLVGVHRGTRIGIPGAPNSLPAPALALRGPWSLCTAPGPVSTLAIGQPDTGGVPLGERGLLVRQGGTTYLVWHGHRYPIADPDIVVP